MIVSAVGVLVASIFSHVAGLMTRCIGRVQTLIIFRLGGVAVMVLLGMYATQNHPFASNGKKIVLLASGQCVLSAMVRAQAKQSNHLRVDGRQRPSSCRSFQVLTQPRHNVFSSLYFSILFMQVFD